MRLILATVVILISLTLVVSDSIENERSKLIGEAMNCCSTPCGAAAMRQFRDKIAIFVARFGADTVLESYFEKFFNGELCSPNRKAAKASFAGISCPYGPYDVAGGDVIVNCTFDVYHTAGVYYGSISASAVSGGSYVGYVGSTGYYYDTTASSVFWSGTVQLLLKQYSSAGNYSVNLWSYASNYTSYVSAQAVFGVLATLNDQFPPALGALNIPPINLYDLGSAFAGFTATDDRSGISQFSVNVYNASGTYGYGYYYAPTVNGRVVGQTNIKGSVQIYFYYGMDINAGLYNVSVYMYDVVGRSRYLYGADLNAAGFQATLIVSQSYCPAGKYLPYGQSGACLSCALGSYSPNFAFRCKACSAGTFPNATGSCAQCPPGTYGVGGNYYCTYCPAGYYSNTFGAKVCQPCYAGAYSASVGSTSCTYCPAGSYSYPASTGSSGCTLCPKGSASSYAYNACSLCEAGYFAANDGSTSCSACPSGSYSSAVGSTSCTSCPPSQSSPMGSNSQLNCA